MKTFNIRLFFILLFACIVQTLSAQSIRRAEGSVFARQKSDNIYEPVPAGVISYKVEKGKFWQLTSGVIESDKPKGYLTQSDGKVYYYNQNDEIVGSYVPSENRFYSISSSSGKIDTYATLFDGVLALGSGEIRYKVDQNFDPKVIGFFLFVH